MNIIDFISADAVVPDFKASNKRQALQILGRKAADIAGLEQHLVMDILMERERLGSTGVGAGVAIPHGKVANLNKLYGVFGKTDEAIEFDSIDEQPVDLIFLLLAPDIAGADHLKLALLAAPAAPHYSLLIFSIHNQFSTINQCAPAVRASRMKRHRYISCAAI